MKISKENKQKLLTKVKIVESQIEDIRRLLTNVKIDANILKETIQNTNDYDRIEDKVISLHVQISQLTESSYIEFETSDII